METYLSYVKREYYEAIPTAVYLWGGAGVVMLVGALILASKAIERILNRKHPDREDEVWR